MASSPAVLAGGQERLFPCVCSPSAFTVPAAPALSHSSPAPPSAAPSRLGPAAGMDTDSTDTGGSKIPQGNGEMGAVPSHRGLEGPWGSP